MSTAPLQFVLMVFAGWVNRRRLDMIEYRVVDVNLGASPRSDGAVAILPSECRIALQRLTPGLEVIDLARVM